MSHVADTELGDLSTDFSTLNYPVERINTCETSDESEWENNFSTDIIAQKMRYSIKDFFRKLRI